MYVHHVTVTFQFKMGFSGCGARQGSLAHPLPCTRGCWLTFRAWYAFSFSHPACCAVSRTFCPHRLLGPLCSAVTTLLQLAVLFLYAHLTTALPFRALRILEHLLDCRIAR